jgi:hypothetical protein
LTIPSPNGRGARLPAALLVVVGLFLVLLAWLAVRLELRVAVEADGDAPIVATLRLGEGRPQQLARAPTLAEGDLEVTHLAGPRVRLRVDTRHHGRVRGEDLRIEAGGWDEDDQERLVSHGPGSRFTWRGVTSGLFLELARGPRAGSIAIRWDGHEQRIDLAQPKPARQVITLRSPRRILFVRIPPWTSRLRVDAAPIRGPAVLTLGFGNETFLERVSAPGAAALDVRLGRRERLHVIGRITAHAAGVAARTALLLAAYFLAGLPVVGAALGRLTPLERLWVPVAVGFTTLGVLTTSLAYVLPVRAAFPLVVAALVVAGGLGLRGHIGVVRELLRAAVTRQAGWRFPALTAVLSAAVMFFPALLEDGWYLGHSYIDVWYYTNLPQQFLHAPMTQVAPTATTLRYAELVSLAVSSIVLGSDTRSLFAVQALALWATVPFLTAALLGRLGVGGVPARVTTVLAAFSAAWFSVFTQGYFAHYVFTFTLLWALHLTIICLEEMPRTTTRERWALRTATAGAYAFNVAAYPFQFLLPLGWALLVGLRHRAPGHRDRMRELAAVGVLALLLVNVNLSVVVMYPTISRNFGHWKLVNAIGRNLVFPYYASPEMLLVTYGVRDQVLNSDRSAPILRQVLNRAASRRRGVLDVVGHVYRGAAWPVAIAALALTVAGLVAAFARGAGDARLLTGMTVATFVGYLVVSAWTAQTYAFGKVGLTLGVLVLPMLGLALGSLWTGRRAATTRPLLAAFALAFLGLNLVSSGFESADAYLSRKSNLVYHLRTHIPVIDVELKRLATFFAEEHRRLGRPIRIVTECQLADWRGSDHDVVLRRRIDHLAVLHGEGLAPPADAPMYRVVFPEPGCGVGATSAEPVLATRLYRVYADGVR